MMYAMIVIPAAAAVLSLMIQNDRLRRGLLIGAAAVHALLVLAAWHTGAAPRCSGWLVLDPPALLFLTITSILFSACSVYAVGYLAGESGQTIQDFEEGLFFRNAPEAVFCACLLAFLSTMTLTALSQHLALLWVAMEATTLASAPLIYFHRHHRSLEAAWKYLLICSVGIALALLGTFFIGIAVSHSTVEDKSLVLSNLIQQGSRLNLTWLKAAMLLTLVGYGTKMGLAPLHTWLPDAHSESPSVISALLSGALLNCAFLGILRLVQVCRAAGLEDFYQPLLILFGLLSMGWAAVFILGQADFKRMLAYSSVEHVGILALGIGIGAGAVFGSMLHAVNHSLTKAMLFLAAGNILGAFKTKTISQVSGILERLPLTGILWLAGFLAITGMPPFGLFLSEFAIVKAMIEQGRFGIAAAFLGVLTLIFAGMASAFLKMAQGPVPRETTETSHRESFTHVVPPLALGTLTLLLGLYVPPAVNRLLHEAAAAFGGL